MKPSGVTTRFIFLLLLLVPHMNSAHAAQPAFSVSSPLTYSSSTNTVALPSPLPVSAGGTGNTSFSNPYGLIYADPSSGTMKLSTLSPGTSGQVLISNGPNTAPSFGTPTVPLWNVNTITSSFSVTSSQNGYMFLCSNGPTINLPSILTLGSVNGFNIVIKKTDASAGSPVYIVGYGADLIDGASSLYLTQQNASVWLMTDGTAWRILRQ